MIRTIVGFFMRRKKYFDTGFNSGAFVSRTMGEMSTAPGCLGTSVMERTWWTFLIVLKG